MHNADIMLEAAEAFVALVSELHHDDWDRPGLGVWDVRSLVGHTGRAVITVLDYLPKPAETADLASAAHYRVQVLPATHHALGEAVLYAVQRDGRSLLYATDTGPWRTRLLELVRGWTFDLVLLEETFGDKTPPNAVHHNFVSFGAAVQALCAVGAVDDATRVVAIHLGHDNPRLAELTSRLAALGAEVHPDLTVLHI